MVRFTALLLTVSTGLSALVYEVAWHKYLAALLGSQSEATAAVLAIFLGGLAAGYALFGWLTRRLIARARRSGGRLRLLLFYGGVEAAIGVYALLFPTLFGVAQELSLLAPHAWPGLAFAFDVALSALLIGPPTVLMGATIPVLTLALAPDLERATRIHAWVYGFNTVGAFLGALLGGFWIVPRLGLDGTLYAMALLNLAAGGAFAALERGAERVAPSPPAPSPVRAPRHFAAYAGVALLAGFAMMALQTTLNRIGALAFGASQFTFAMVVAVFVLATALGSLAVSALPRVPRALFVDAQIVLLLALTLLYPSAADAPYFAHVVRTIFQPVDAAFYPYHFAVLLALLALLAVPIGLSGALLPLLFHALRREVDDLGSVAGRLYAWNTVGSLLGALLAGYLLLFWLDLHHVYRIALAAIAAGLAVSMVLAARMGPLAAGLFVFAPALALLLLLPGWSPDRLAAGLFRQRDPQPSTYVGPDAYFEHLVWRSIFYDDDPTSSVSVSEEAGAPDARLGRGLVVNGKPEGKLDADYPTMALAALVPALMAERHERSFVIGWGTGVTIGELAALEGMRKVEVAEISQAVIDAAPLFDAGNLGASRSPKVEVRRSDAYRALLQSEERYDVIVSEPSNPWVTGVEMLYSADFLTVARDHLAPGGVYAQWIHVYEIDAESVELVLRTYARVFPNVSVWFTLASDLLLLGFDATDRALDLPALEARFREPDFAAGFARVGIESLPALLAHEVLPLGTIQATDLPGPVHTLRHPILSYQAARAFFRGGVAELPRFARPDSAAVGARNSLLRRYAADAQGRFSEAALEAAVSECCRHGRFVECAALLARWIHDHPESPRLREALAQVRRTRPTPAPLTDANLVPLAALFDGAGTAPASKRPLLRATQTTQRFARFYHHAAPFDRRALARVWSGCASDACRAQRRAAEERLGPFDGPAASGRP
jgi:predicted membrane-bound spermidine synthase